MAARSKALEAAAGAASPHGVETPREGSVLLLGLLLRLLLRSLLLLLGSHGLLLVQFARLDGNGPYAVFARFRTVSIRPVVHTRDALESGLVRRDRKPWFRSWSIA